MAVIEPMSFFTPDVSINPNETTFEITDLMARSKKVVFGAAFSTLPLTRNAPGINSSMECVHAILSNRSAQTGDWDVTTNDNGDITVSGSISGSTTLTMYFLPVSETITAT